MEIFSNSYAAIRKRLNDEKEDNFSFFNTQRVIEDEVENIFATHRKRLFEQHGKKFEKQVQWPYKNSPKNESEARIVLRSVGHDPSVELQRLAVAYYRVAYSKFLAYLRVF